MDLSTNAPKSQPKYTESELSVRINLTETWSSLQQVREASLTQVISDAIGAFFHGSFADVVALVRHKDYLCILERQMCMYSISVTS